LNQVNDELPDGGSIDPPNAEVAETTASLDKASALFGSIEREIGEASKLIQAWFEARGQRHSDALGVIRQHVHRVTNHSSALSEWMRKLTGPHAVVYAAASVGEPPQSNGIVEVDDAYDDKKLASLTSRDLSDAIEFNTEFKQTFGFVWIDEEGREPLTDAMEELLALLEDGSATVPGMLIKALKKAVKGHVRGFGRYYTGGSDPWPRPPAIVEAEIEYRMPDALWWLRQELADAKALAKAMEGGDGQ
jgi:hypothetical protein